MSADLINGAFEFGGAMFSLLNISALWRQRKLSGVSWIPTAFFTSWGLWNLFYYPHLHQPISFCGGLAIVVVNAIWLTSVAVISRSRIVSEVADD